MHFNYLNLIMQLMAIQKGQQTQMGKNMHFLSIFNTIACLCILFLVLFQQNQINNLTTQLEKQKQRNAELIAQFQRESQDIHDQIERIHNDLTEIQMSEMIEDERKIGILKKYSKKFNFQANRFASTFEDEFKVKQNGTQTTYLKMTDSQKFISSLSPFPSDGIFYIQIGISKTSRGKIALGIMPASKIHDNCNYCDSSQISYFYGENGMIYRGQILGLMNSKRQSKADRAKEGDRLAMFIDMSRKEVSWYLNGLFMGRQKIIESIKKDEIYPFIDISDIGDAVSIM